MTATALSTYPIEIDDVEYLRHGGKPLLARIFRPRGTGTFPLVVELHGGAWCLNDRCNDDFLNTALAESGVVVMAVDFRMPPEAAYPADMADINYAVRWAKQRAIELRADPARLGLIGCSSGAHQAMLSAMRPRDLRYAALPLSGQASRVDAGVRCVVMCWPVVDPLARYAYVRKLKAGGGPYPEFVDRVLPCHDAYWQTQQAMAEGNPVLALERGEALELPPALCVQGTADLAHPRVDLDRFARAYRHAGGRVDLKLYEGEGEAFFNRNRSSPAVARAVEDIKCFVHAELA